MHPSPDPARLKRLAAARALELVQDGMVLGLGTGSTAAHFIAGAGRLAAAGMRLTAVPTSIATARQAKAAGLVLVDDPPAAIDLAVDGADEIDGSLSLIKGRGGALLREKLVAVAAERFVVIADSSKLVSRLGRGTLPVEVSPFLWRRTAMRLAALGAAWELRGGEAAPARTDNGNLIVDLLFAGGLADPAGLATSIAQVPGVMESGLFVGLAAACIIASEEGVTVLGSLAG